MTDTKAYYPPLPSKLSCALPLTADLVLIALVEEAYMRLTTPFITEAETRLFDPETGILYTSYTEVRVANRIDFWSASSVNRPGFLDCEPSDPKQTAEGCLIAMIGDSVVAAE